MKGFSGFSFLLVLSGLLSLVFAQSAATYDPSPFTIIAPIEAMTVTTPTDPLSGGTLQLEGITIIIPKNLLVTLPNLAVSWSEMFTSAGAPNLPLFGSVTWEASVTANKVGGQYIAGLVYIYQEFLQTSSGFITAIDYTTGQITVGGSTTIIINDPSGRFAKPRTEWPLWTIDPENPSIRASTGFPLCLPKTDPAVLDDPLCPKKNRPLDAAGKAKTAFNFPVPGSSTTAPDANLAAPLVVGDYIIFNGVQVTPSLIAVFALEANLGFYTAPGSTPSYITITVGLWGIVGNPLGEIAETRIEGYSTDETVSLEVFAVDVDPCTGASTNRILSAVTQRAAGRRGQWLYRAVGVGPATRQVGVRVQGRASTTNTNGISTGLFIQPILNLGFIFPELLLFGTPEIVYEFNLIPFLAQGSGPWVGGIPGATPNPNPPIVGQLSPWPGATPPTPATCSPIVISQNPVANAGPDIAAASGQTVSLVGSQTNTNIPPASVAFLWTQTAGPTVALTNANAATASFVAPTVTTPTTFTFSLKVTVGTLTSTDSVIVTVQNGADTVTIVSATFVTTKGTGLVTVVAQSSVTDGSAVLSLFTISANTGPTIMTSLGGGKYTASVNLKKKPVSVTVTSNLGGTASRTL